jgi:hypothetical protein
VALDQPPKLAPAQGPGVLKSILQLLVCLTIGLRCIALFDHLRRAWITDGLAVEFRRELRRRGLLDATPSPRGD